MLHVSKACLPNKLIHPWKQYHCVDHEIQLSYMFLIECDKISIITKAS